VMVVMKKGPFEHCSDPIALQVCKESREHTLSRYMSMQHLETKEGSFYFSPSRDVLLLSVDYTNGYYTDDVMYYSNELKRFYNGQLNYIKTVLVLHHKWVETTPAGYVKFLDIFGGLEIIQLLYLQDNDDEEDEEDEDEDEDEDHHNNHDMRSLNVESLRRYANELRAEYTEVVLNQPDWSKRRVNAIQVIDRSGQFY
jgi:hypothetical protein